MQRVGRLAGPDLSTHYWTCLQVDIRLVDHHSWSVENVSASGFPSMDLALEVEETTFEMDQASL